MDTTEHSLSTLFAQLGLPDDSDSISQFIKVHRPLNEEVSLSEAHWWNESQKRFIQEALQSDSDWAIPVDELNMLLREHEDQ